MQSDTSESLHPRINLEINFLDLLISYRDSGVLLLFLYSRCVLTVILVCIYCYCNNGVYPL